MGWLCLFCPLFFFEHSVLFVSTREAVFYVVYHHSSIRTLPDSCVMSLESQSVFPPKERGQTALAGGCGACSFQILPAWLKSEVLLNVSLNIFFFFRGSSIVKIMIKTIFSFVPVILGSWQIDTFLGFCFFFFFCSAILLFLLLLQAMPIVIKHWTNLWMKGRVFSFLSTVHHFQWVACNMLANHTLLGNAEMISFWLVHLWSTEGVVVLVLIKLHNQWESCSS